MRTYHHDAAPLAYAPPAVNLLLLGLSALVLGGVLALGFHGWPPSPMCRSWARWCVGWEKLPPSLWHRCRRADRGGGGSTFAI